jgi:catechol 2,3-dioxygenase-like lactoylglutathione lyase family enzyme
MKLEVVVVPVSDVDRAKNFYQGLEWRLDADPARIRSGAATRPSPRSATRTEMSGCYWRSPRACRGDDRIACPAGGI